MNDNEGYGCEIIGCTAARATLVEGRYRCYAHRPIVCPICGSTACSRDAVQVKCHRCGKITAREKQFVDLQRQ